jgi:hypothetical protein
MLAGAGISARLLETGESKMDQPGLSRLRAQDRDELSTLLTVLHGAMNALHRDECGDPTIFGSRGHVRACDGMFHIYVRCRSPKAWTYAKRQLAGFTTVQQDGDDEGVLVLSRLPDESEAATLRDYIGLHQTKQVSPDVIQNLKAARKMDRYGGSIAPNPAPGQEAAE